MMHARAIVTATLLLVLQLPMLAQTQQAKLKPKKAANEAEALAAARRTLAETVLTSLAYEARSFKDLALRARVQARAADALWETDRENARALFRRAWESAEAADEELQNYTKEQQQAWMATRGSTARRQPPNLRREVLRLAAKADRDLGEEFLKKLEESMKQEAANAPTATPTQGTPRINPDNPPPAMAQRLNLARQLLDDGDTERALQFADAGLYPVNTFGMNILDILHEKNPSAADERYMSLLARAIVDPVSDANTISLLSAYIFTPYLYVTVRPDGNSHTRNWSPGNVTRDNIAPATRNAFFRTAATVLLGPVQEPDLSSSGRAGTFVVIARMLPLFERFGNDQAPALRARLGQLNSEVPERLRAMDDQLFTRGIVPDKPEGDMEQEMMDRIERAKTSDERDQLLFRAAMNAAGKDYEKAHQLAGKIEDTDLRKQVMAYLRFDAMRRAIQAKKPDDALRFAKAEELTPVQRAWGLTEIARLLGKTEAERASAVLDDAIAEVRRIDQSSQDRVRMLVAVITQMQKVDNARAWDMVSELIKAANAVSGFSGEEGELTTRVAFKGGGAMTNNFGVESFDLNGLFAALAQEDFNRAADLPKGFTGESPRALATLAIARTALGKK